MIKLVLVSMNRLYSQFLKYSYYLRLFFQTIIKPNNTATFSCKTIRLSPFLSLFSKSAHCGSQKQQQIEQITKQQLVFLLNKSPAQEFVVILYDRFKKLNEAQFKDELQAIINQCRIANIKKMYMVDSKQAKYLHKVVKILKNLPESQEDQPTKSNSNKPKSFQSYFKSKQYNQAFQLYNTPEYKISQQISQIRNFQVTTNSDKFIEEVTHHANNKFIFNRAVVIKQCPGQGQCVQSYKNQVKKLINGGMLNGKTDQFKFYLVVDHPQGILGVSSQYFKNYQKFLQKMSGGNLSAIHRKQEILILRKDIFGSQLNFWSDWLQKTGSKYDVADRFMMFIHPRVHYITKKNALCDLTWLLRVAKLNGQPSICLNNTPLWASTNGTESINTLKLLHSYYPKLNYLIVNTDEANQLIRHMNADHKYVLFLQDSQIIWKKLYLDLDKIEKIQSQNTKNIVFQKQFKHQIEDFIANPAIKNLLKVDKQMQISFEKLKILKERQSNIPSIKNYIIRICKQRCGRYIKQDILQQIKAKLKGETNVYWIDSTAQNIGLKTGDYILKQGKLINLYDYLTDI